MDKLMFLKEQVEKLREQEKQNPAKLDRFASEYVDGLLGGIVSLIESVEGM